MVLPWQHWMSSGRWHWHVTRCAGEEPGCQVVQGRNGIYLIYQIHWNATSMSILEHASFIENPQNPKGYCIFHSAFLCRDPQETQERSLPGNEISDTVAFLASQLSHFVIQLFGEITRSDQWETELWLLAIVANWCQCCSTWRLEW